MKNQRCTRARCNGHHGRIHEVAVELFDADFPDFQTDEAILDLAHELQRAFENWASDFEANLPICPGCSWRHVPRESDFCDLCASFARTQTVTEKGGEK